jgi:hypothetical protein
MMLRDNYDSQMRRLRAMCEAEGLADQDVTLTLKFAYQGQKVARPQTLAMKDRIEAALKEFGLVYTMVQDPESTFLNPVFVMFLVGPTGTVLEFYEAIGDHQ